MRLIDQRCVEQDGRLYHFSGLEGIMNDAPDPPDGHSAKAVLLIALTFAAIAVSAYILVQMD
jgi:hypothetical protein